MEFKPILKLDTSYGHCDELKIEFRDMDLIATVQYYRTAGTSSRTCTFGFVEAHSLYSEMMLPLTAHHCHDQLCEVAGSDWVKRPGKCVAKYSRLPPLRDPLFQMRIPRSPQPSA